MGGHAVLCVGYNDTMTVQNPDGSTSTGLVLVRNSWGSDWGMGGYFTIPYTYLADTNLADDFWTIRVVK